MGQNFAAGSKTSPQVSKHGVQLQTLKVHLQGATPAKPIRVVFLLFYFEAWDSLAPIFDEMKASPLFTPIVVTMPRKLTGDVVYGGEGDVHRFLTELDIAHVRLKGDDHLRNLQKLKSLEPDYVFLNYPWQRNYPPPFRPDSLVKFTRIAYVPYFLLPLVDEESPEGAITQSTTQPIAGHLYEQRTHQLASLIFVQDEVSKTAFASTSRGDEHVFATGSPKLDVLRQEAAKLAKKRAKKQKAAPSASKYALRVLWAPHHSYSPAWLNFGRFAADHDAMLKFAESNPNIKVTLRPHPFLFGTLVDRGVLTRDELEFWLAKWNALPNTRITRRASFVKQFSKNDLLLTDGISFLAEYPLLTGKPAIFIENPQHWSFNRLGSLAADCNLRVRSVDEFAAIAHAFIEHGFTAAVGKELERYSNSLTTLRAMVDPNPGMVAKNIVAIVAKHFVSGAPLVKPSVVAETAWEDRPGREPRTD